MWRERSRMRKSLVAGLVLAVAAVLVVWVSSALDLELESVALLGAALGAVVALVPDRTPLIRLCGFFAGFVAAWIGYAMRAQFLPDSAGGRAACFVSPAPDDEPGRDPALAGGKVEQPAQRWH